MSDAQWESLRVPVDMAFFFYNTPAEKVVAYYPSPMGPTESLLKLEAWEELEGHNPVLKEWSGTWRQSWSTGRGEPASISWFPWTSATSWLA